jgi:hypothetical protein
MRENALRTSPRRPNAVSQRQRRRRPATPSSRAGSATKPALVRARRKFLRVFPNGFRDATYLEWERAYKWRAHLGWHQRLAPDSFRKLLNSGEHRLIARTAIAIESRTNLLFSFEKMALRDAVATNNGARIVATGLFSFLYGDENLQHRFDTWVESVGRLPRRQTRVLTGPVVTVFGFIAEPRQHFFFKPTVTRTAARRLAIDLPYASRPSWPVYKGVLDVAKTLRTARADLRPRDMIDIQSFLWVQGSDEYPD